MPSRAAPNHPRYDDSAPIERGNMAMILKFVTKNGTKVYGPPYTKKEEADFYSRNANGPVTVARAADCKARKSQAPQHPSPAKPARDRN
jgi:hypothetical protein